MSCCSGRTTTARAELDHDNGFNIWMTSQMQCATCLLKDGGKEVGRKPIKHSPEIRQAKSRIKEYEERAWSGEMSDDIFSGANDGAQDLSSNLTEGINGIGTGGGVAGDDSASKSTASFLDKKKQDVKADYNFKTCQQTSTRYYLNPWVRRIRSLVENG